MAETLRKKLLNIQRDLKAPKGQYNNFGKFSYRNAEDIMEALKPLLVDNNTICYCKDDYIEHIGERYYLVATIVFADVETDEEITVKARAREEENKKGMDGSQITGAASSYARKYALSGLFLIDDNKDADSDEYQQQNNKNQGKKQPSKQNQANQQQQPNNQQAQQQNQVRYIDNIQYQEIYKSIQEFATVKGAPFDTVASFVLSKYQIQDFHQVPVDGYNLVMEYLNGQIQKAYAKQGA
ncbi:ERF family protein [Streptococcus hyovaginalis]|uniref:ERF family protein n=1 Tax=Streptococcus hyovaginalis TaxID=149015 RepID=UPI00042A4187|nr:ERF family protein [Streptococcus hyovaginalis]QBX25456.1 essential recombination function protein [Streptococcus phage Javan258]